MARRAPRFASTADVRVVAAVAEQTLRPSPGFLDSTQTIHLPFAARLGERPLSVYQREAVDLNVKVSSDGKSTRVKSVRNNPRQDHNLTRLQELIVDRIPMPRPHTAPDTHADVSKGEGTLAARQHSRKQKLGSSSPVKAPSSAIIHNMRQTRATTNPFSAPDRWHVAGNTGESEESDLQGAELEVLLKKQLELVSRVQL